MNENNEMFGEYSKLGATYRVSSLWEWLQWWFIPEKSFEADGVRVSYKVLPGNRLIITREELV